VVDRSISSKGASAGGFMLEVAFHHTQLVYGYLCSHAPAHDAHAAVVNSLPRPAALLLSQLGPFLQLTQEPNGWIHTEHCMTGSEDQLLGVQVCTQQT
jgi:hypothetical protein